MKHFQLPDVFASIVFQFEKSALNIVRATLSGLKLLIRQTALTAFFASVALTIRLPKPCLFWLLSGWTCPARGYGLPPVHRFSPTALGHVESFSFHIS